MAEKGGYVGVPDDVELLTISADAAVTPVTQRARIFEGMDVKSTRNRAQSRPGRYSCNRTPSRNTVAL